MIKRRWNSWGCGIGPHNMMPPDSLRSPKKFWLLLPAGAVRALGLKPGAQNYVDFALETDRAGKRLVIHKSKQPKSKKARLFTDHYCPKCGAGLVSQPIIGCSRCHWYLMSLAEWRTLPPFDQGYILYMQGSWPMSELAQAKNPYKEGTAQWKKFCEGQERAVLSAQDSEE